MKKFSIILILILTVSFVFAQGGGDVLEFKAKVGFTDGEDKIVEHKFIDGGRKLLIIGQKNLQIWDVESARLLSSAAHRIPQFAPRGFVSSNLLLGLPQALDWRPFLIDDRGEWIITAEKTGSGPLRSGVVRDLRNLKQIATLELPNVSTEYISFDKNENEILTFGMTDKNAAFAVWDKNRFAANEIIRIDEYKWHQKIRNGTKMIVGSGDTKILWSGANVKQGDSLTVRAVETGTVEKEFTAAGLKPGTAFQETTVTADEKFLVSKRDDRIFVWEIDRAGQPKFEISQPNPKGNFNFLGIFDRRFIVVEIDEQLRVYGIDGGGEPLLTVSRQTPKEDIDFIKIFGGRFAAVQVDRKLRVYDTGAGNAPLIEVASDDSKDTVRFCGATGDGKYAVACDDRKVSVYDVTGGGKPVYEIVRQSEKERFPAVKILTDKNLLAVARVNRNEKKASKTEFYDIATGKLIFEAAFAATGDVKFTPDEKYLYQTELGVFSVWNIAARRFFIIPLATYTPNTGYDPNSQNYVASESPSNTEYTEFSPDNRYILRHGDDVTAIFETETGKLAQTLFDSEKVKYDKQNKIKKSGYGSAGWVNNGRYVYALESTNLFRSRRTISLWKVKR